MFRKKLKIDEISSETWEIFRKFGAQIGSEHIASPVTIEALSRLCREHKPRRILEMGGGIGTISYILLKYSDAFLDVYEDNEFCLSKLRENLVPFEGRYQIIQNYRISPPVQDYDLMVVDGGSGKAWDGGYPLAVWFFILFLKSVKIVYVEGFRRLQRIRARRALSHRYVYKLTRYDTMILEGKRLHGGLKIDCIPSRSRILRWINFLFWEIVEWTAIRNFFWYRFSLLRRFFKKESDEK